MQKNVCFDSRFEIGTKKHIKHFISRRGIIFSKNYHRKTSYSHYLFYTCIALFPVLFPLFHPLYCVQIVSLFILFVFTMHFCEKLYILLAHKSSIIQQFYNQFKPKYSKYQSSKSQSY